MITKIGKHEWEITVNGEQVTRLFDGDGGETYDPTKATEAVTASGFIDIESGDKITFERIS